MLGSERHSSFKLLGAAFEEKFYDSSAFLGFVSVANCDKVVQRKHADCRLPTTMICAGA